MSDVQYFFTLASGIPSMMAYFFPVTLVVAGLWVWGLIVTRNRSPERIGRLVLCCTLPAILTIGILVLGVVFVYRGPSLYSLSDYERPKFPVYLINGLGWAHLPLAGLLGWLTGRQWPVVVASSMVWGWASACALFTSTMSVTGIWL